MNGRKVESGSNEVMKSLKLEGGYCLDRQTEKCEVCSTEALVCENIYIKKEQLEQIEK